MPNVNDHYERCQDLASSARALQKAGYELVDLNVGNPGALGFGCRRQCGLPSSRTCNTAMAIVSQPGFIRREKRSLSAAGTGVRSVTADDVMIGTGVSELIDLTLRALIDDGDEILVPRPDYPLWTAAVELNGGVVKYYDCRKENGYLPDPERIAALVTPRTRGLVLINPNNPTGAVYPDTLLRALVDVAEAHGLIQFSDEIYAGIVYGGAEFVPLAPLVSVISNGLWRLNWVVSPSTQSPQRNTVGTLAEV